MHLKLPKGWVFGKIALQIFTFTVVATNSEPSLAQNEDSILDFIPSILAAAKPLPRPINFKVKLPQIGPRSIYVIELKRWGLDGNNSDSVATTNRLQAAIDWGTSAGYNQIVVPDGHFPIGKYGNSIYQAGLTLDGDLEFVLSANTVLEMAPNNKWNYCVIAVTGKSNVIIRGGQIKGDRANHTYTPRTGDGATAHDEGHAICLQSSTQKVLIEGMKLHSVTGDGVLLVNEVKDVTIRNNEIFNNRRQGVSIVGGQRIAILNNHIHHIRGTSPQFGVDIEGAGRIDKDIIIRGNKFHHNRGGDIVNTSGKNVFIINNTLDQGTAGFENRYIDGPLVTWERTDNVIAYNTITMYDRSVNGLLGFIQYSSDRDNNPQTTFVHNNECNGCGMYMYDAGDVDIRKNRFKGYFLSLSNVKNATVIDNQVTYGPPGSPRYCWDYRIRNTTGFAKGNLLEGKPFTLPLSSQPWTSACLKN